MIESRWRWPHHEHPGAGRQDAELRLDRPAEALDLLGRTTRRAVQHSSIGQAYSATLDYRWDANSRRTQLRLNGQNQDASPSPNTSSKPARPPTAAPTTRPTAQAP